MHQTCLAFSSFDHLWNFKQVCSLDSFVIKPDKYLLIGNFREDDINTAIQYYNASIIEKIVPAVWWTVELKNGNCIVNTCLN